MCAAKIINDYFLTDLVAPSPTFHNEQLPHPDLQYPRGLSIVFSHIAVLVVARAEYPIVQQHSY